MNQNITQSTFIRTLFFKAFRRLTAKCMQQKFSTSSFRSGQSLAGPNREKSFSIFASTSLLNLFCVDAESDNSLIAVE